MRRRARRCTREGTRLECDRMRRRGHAPARSGVIQCRQARTLPRASAGRTVCGLAPGGTRGRGPRMPAPVGYDSYAERESGSGGRGPSRRPRRCLAGGAVLAGISGRFSFSGPCRPLRGRRHAPIRLRHRPRPQAHAGTSRGAAPRTAQASGPCQGRGGASRRRRPSNRPQTGARRPARARARLRAPRRGARPGAKVYTAAAEQVKARKALACPRILPCRPCIWDTAPPRIAAPNRSPAVRPLGNIWSSSGRLIACRCDPPDMPRGTVLRRRSASRPVFSLQALIGRAQSNLSQVSRDGDEAISVQQRPGPCT